MIKPLRNQVLVHHLEHGETIQKGVIIPKLENREFKAREAMVVEVGPDVQWCEVGDLVLASRSGGVPYKAEDGTKYELFQEHDILALFKRPNKE